MVKIKAENGFVKNTISIIEKPFNCEISLGGVDVDLEIKIIYNEDADENRILLRVTVDGKDVSFAADEDGDFSDIHYDINETLEEWFKKSFINIEWGNAIEEIADTIHDFIESSKIC